jgi:hypothetical protein
MVRPGTQIPRTGSKDHNVSVIATALLRRGLLQANAVRFLVANEAPEVGIPNIRSLYEAFGELHYLLERDSEVRAQTALIFAVQEIKRYLQRWPEGNTNDLRHLERELDQHARSAPDGFARASGRTNYWTDGTRAGLIDAALSSLSRSSEVPAPQDLGRQLYKVLSWDDHHVMAALVTIDLAQDSQTLGTIKAEHPGGDRYLLEFLTFMALEGMRRWYVGAFPETETPITDNA